MCSPCPSGQRRRVTTVEERKSLNNFAKCVSIRKEAIEPAPYEVYLMSLMYHSKKSGSYMFKKSAKTDQAKNPLNIGSSLAAKRAKLANRLGLKVG
jgi:hypothetical protein